ncbi:MAG TPA: Gfo/Idh/MocA family oxidoreductase, partial [Chloroflexota bacterium]|nr:Gfo/Idh/MocA family oxidoreductase [Chloroflexota bacterium]
MMTIAPPTTAPLRIGVCGSGITVVHIAGYQKIPGVEVVAIAGPDVERCQAVAAEYGISQVFADYRDMLALGLDAVSIGVPNKFHAQMAIDILAAGCHVLCEKPLAINAADAERMVAAARGSDKILMVAFNRRYIPNAIVLKRLIDEGALGPIYYARAGWTRRAG